MATPPRQKAGSQPKGLFTSLKSMFGLDSPPPPQPPKPVVRIHKADGEEEHWVPLSLDEVLERKPDAEIHLITLRQFRVAVGDMWPRISNKAILLADATLRQVAGSGCIMKQSQEENFLLSFPKLQPVEGRRRATAAAIALGQKLVGAKFKITGTDDTDPAICMASVRAGDLAGADGRLNFDLVEAAAALSRPVGDPIPQSGETGGTVSAGSGLTDAVRLHGQEETGPEWEKIQRQRQAAGGDDTPENTDPARKPEEMPEWERLRWERMKAGQTKADGSSPATGKAEDMPEWEKIQRARKPQEMSLELVLMQKERLNKAKSEPEWVPIQKK
ncbi:hypothetical protein GCM10027256_32880 [Novispirillum itersonii subsp. nipponicum]